MSRQRIIRPPFKGSWFYEWQIGPVVLQVRHTRVDAAGFGGGDRIKLLGVWLEPHWRRR